jgi:hypothetical protein
VRHRIGLWSFFALFLGSSCQAYDGTPLNAKPKASAQTVPVSKSPGTPDEQPDGPVMTEVSPPEPPPTRCGDGIISGVEKCDTAIERGESGACPSECPALAACAPRVLNGTACQAECLLIEPSCVDDDECCPSTCNLTNDNDCSRDCGDGKIDAEAGETCEPEVKPCEKDDKACDDNDPCTEDRLLGGPQNCNSLCSHTEITERIAGDQCCPEGADNSVDDDCSPVCGNGVRERGEDCDASEGCGSDCKSQAQTAQTECIDRFGSDECMRCSCTLCTELVVACWDSGDETRNARCSAVVECGQRAQCVDVDCFCAPGSPPCVPTGPCNMEISTAAGTNDPFWVDAYAADPNSTLGRARNATACRVANCQKECGAKVAQ